jgi:DNA-binding transcriptional LysR family regulator
LATHGAPAAIADLEYHNCLSVAGDDVWRLEGPEGAVEVRTSSKVHSGSGEFINEALCAGVGIGLRSTWEVGSKLRSGDLKIVLPAYRGPSTMAIYAEYPRREFVPAKVQGLIDFLTEIYGPEPSWDRFPRLDSDAAISLKPAVSRGAKGLRASAGAR